jgi:hypothetical protein
MKREEDQQAVRITQQFRSGEAMVYDLRSANVRITMRVSGRGGESSGPPAEWCIEARTGHSPESLVVAEWAPTRSEALRAVGKAWNSGTRDLPAIDWESVARAMSAVRAI